MSGRWCSCWTTSSASLDAAPVVSELLAAAPGLHVLVTSRSALRLYGEHEYPVPPLRVPSRDDRRKLESLARNEAVSLFVARARAVRHDFRLAPGNAAAVAEICVALDGLPLALELAAARCRQLSPETLAERLGRAARGSDRRAARPTGSAADDACDDRMELRAARGVGAGALRRARRLRRRFHARGGGSGVRRSGGGGRGARRAEPAAARGAATACRAFACSRPCASSRWSCWRQTRARTTSDADTQIISPPWQKRLGRRSGIRCRGRTEPFGSTGWSSTTATSAQRSHGPNGRTARRSCESRQPCSTSGSTAPTSRRDAPGSSERLRTAPPQPRCARRRFTPRPTSRLRKATTQLATHWASRASSSTARWTIARVSAGRCTCSGTPLPGSNSTGARWPWPRSRWLLLGSWGMRAGSSSRSGRPALVR